MEEEKLVNEIINTVKTEIGALAKPDKIQFVNGLQKLDQAKL